MTAEEPPEESGPSKGEAALADAVEWFHARLDDEITDHTEDGEHPKRPTTAREWFEDVRPAFEVWLQRDAPTWRDRVGGEAHA